MNKLSVIMVNLNTRELAIESLQKIRTSLNGISSETFFVDNGSKDGSVEAVASKFSRVNIIANTDNLGFSHAVNQAILKCNGEYILLLNPDITIHANTVGQLVNFMEVCPEAGAVSPYLSYPDGRQQDFCSLFPTLRRQFLQLTGLRILVPHWIKRRFTILKENRTEPFEVDWVIGACVILRRKAVENAGYLDEDFFMYGEDLDLCYRLRKNGWKVYVLPDVKIFHIGSPKDTLRSGIFKEPLIHHTTYLFFKKHHGPVLALVLVVIQRFVSLIRFFFWVGIFLTFRSMRDKARMKCRIHLSCLKGFNSQSGLI